MFSVNVRSVIAISGFIGNAQINILTTLRKRTKSPTDFAQNVCEIAILLCKCPIVTTCDSVFGSVLYVRNSVVPSSDSSFRIRWLAETTSA